MLNKKIAISLLCIILVLIGTNVVAVYQLYLHNNSFKQFEKEIKTIQGLCAEQETSFLLDVEYRKQIVTVTNNASITDINYSFANKWEEVANTYYNLIIDEIDEPAQETLTFSKSKWEEYKQSQINSYKECLIYQYQSGSIVPILLSEYEYNLCRNRAIELCNMYFDLIL